MNPNPINISNINEPKNYENFNFLKKILKLAKRRTIVPLPRQIIKTYFKNSIFLNNSFASVQESFLLIGVSYLFK